MARKPAPKAKQRKSSGRMASKGFPNPIDVHVGQRMRQRRTLLGMSQTILGDAIGLTFQQVQKYERGANRVSGIRLFDLGRVLDVPAAYFFEEMPSDMAKESPSHLMGIKPVAEEFEAAPLARRETLELVRAHYKIEDAGARRKLADLVRALSKLED
jgi:transcriptional regulator with XRE-family HTH domain|nr:helix-turn-helix transcriptional regulator [uncultured Dongia sp.]